MIDGVLRLRENLKRSNYSIDSLKTQVVDEKKKREVTSPLLCLPYYIPVFYFAFALSCAISSQVG